MIWGDDTGLMRENASILNGKASDCERSRRKDKTAESTECRYATGV